jgi:hypothetical protein
VSGPEIVVLLIMVATLAFCTGAIHGYEQREREYFEEWERILEEQGV